MKPNSLNSKGLNNRVLFSIILQFRECKLNSRAQEV